MTKIGLISDTHSFLDPKVFEHFADVDEIWHAGDIGNQEIIKQLQDFKPLRIVYGNIDENEIRYKTDENLFFEIENLKVFITHIGAIPPKFNKRIRDLIKKHSPNLFICGHTHILRVLKDKSNFVYINPGAAGHHGFHRSRTIMRMELNDGKVENLEAIVLGTR